VSSTALDDFVVRFGMLIAPVMCCCKELGASAQRRKRRTQKNLPPQSPVRAAPPVWV
jgi:hypothetical protein